MTVLDKILSRTYLWNFHNSVKKEFGVFHKDVKLETKT